MVALRAASLVHGVGAPRGRILAALATVGAVTAAGVAGLGLRRSAPEVAAPVRQVRGSFGLRAPVVDRQTATRAGRRLNRAAGTLAASVLLDSAMEHYRGGFENKAMFTPLVTSALAIAASVHGHRDERHGAHPIRDGVYALAGLTGLVGTAFHTYNVGRRTGGLCWQNLFYAAPLGAPAALVLSGLMGFLGERVRDNPPGTLPVIGGVAAGRAVAAATGAGLLGTAAEAALLHFRGAFHNPAMLLPVTVPPVAAALMASSAVGRAARPHRLARWSLRATALLGFAGSAFHAIGVARNMGGWRNWRQNLFAGPPIPAPPAFTGLALAGLAALGLLQDDPDD